MNKAALLVQELELKKAIRILEIQLEPVKNDLKKLKLLSIIVDDCDNGSGYSCSRRYDHNMQNNPDNPTLDAMEKDGWIKRRDEEYTMPDRYMITPLGRAVLEESEKELA